MLSGSRFLGMQAGPILLSEIKAYIDLFGLPVEREEFVYVIKTMDRMYLSKNDA